LPISISANSPMTVIPSASANRAIVARWGSMPSPDQRRRMDRSIRLIFIAGRDHSAA